MTDADRDSFIDLKRAVMSRRVQAVVGVFVTVVGGAYAWIEGFDKGLEAAGVEIKKIDERIDALEKRAEASEAVAGETLAQLIDVEQGLAEMSEREKKRLETEAKEALADEQAEYERWRAIVMTNASKNRSDAYARTYHANYNTGRRPMDAAHMTLGWGRVER